MRAMQYAANECIILAEEGVSGQSECDDTQGPRSSGVGVRHLQGHAPGGPKAATAPRVQPPPAVGGLRGRGVTCPPDSVNSYE